MVDEVHKPEKLREVNSREERKRDIPTVTKEVIGTIWESQILAIDNESPDLQSLELVAVVLVNGFVTLVSKNSGSKAGDLVEVRQIKYFLSGDHYGYSLNYVVKR